MPGIPVHNGIARLHYVFVERNVERVARQFGTQISQDCVESSLVQKALGRFPQRFVRDVSPPAPHESPYRWVNHDFSLPQLPPRREPPKPVIKIEIAAEMENTLELGQAQGMIEPGAAVQQGHAAHPVRVLVEDQEIEWPIEPAQQGERDVMKVARAVIRQTWKFPAIGQSFTAFALETVISAKRASQANSLPPISERNHFRTASARELL